MDWLNEYPMQELAGGNCYRIGNFTVVIRPDRPLKVYWRSSPTHASLVMIRGEAQAPLTSTSEFKAWLIRAFDAEVNKATLKLAHCIRTGTGRALHWRDHLALAERMLQDAKDITCAGQ